MRSETSRTVGESITPGAWTRPAINLGQPTQTSLIWTAEAKPHSARVRHSIPWTGTSDAQSEVARVSFTISLCRDTSATNAVQFLRPTCNSSGPRLSIGPGRRVWTSPRKLFASMTNTPEEDTAISLMLVFDPG